ncbi:ABC transporter substrate-binding protein [Paracoccus methylarcula]|uniref:ABC transporter substrate-binding protein n=1 Tax=Paracoccus methylarcula TaxID=72022 RepID=A0A3R7LGS4_9RHOB|nr:ABC transporter substrate-binding protein [Paracoccus methylarcula]RNF33454.1 ABC transporter substrate-binding protein [Paracoccus methylarcula]
MKRRMFLQRSTAVIGASALGGLYPGILSAQAHENTLRIAISKAAGDLDLLKHYAIWAVQDLMFEPLVKYGKGGEIEPCLATDWSLEDGGTTLKLTLREGVTFQDGTPFDAAACKWNLERWMGTEKFEWMSCSKNFESVEMVDDYHVNIHFKAPVISLLQELSYTRPSRFVSPNAVDEEGNQVEPIGTGPWRQVSASEAENVFERYDGYWGEKPSYERLEAKVIPESRSRVAALRSGELDVIGGFWIAPLSPIEAKQLEDAGFTISVDPGNVTLVMGFNPDRSEALRDNRVRRAISLGVDREAVGKAFYHGYARPAGSLFSDVLPLSGQQFEAPARDVAAASALLEEAGWTGGPIRSKEGKPLSIEMVISPDAVPGLRIMSEVMQAQLKEIGIDIVIHSVDHATKHTEMLERKYDIGFFLTYGAPFDPFGTIVGLFLSTFKNDVEGKLYTDAEHLDPLINAAIDAKPEDTEAELQKFYDWLHDNDAIAPLLFVPGIWAHSDRVAGFTGPATEYDMPYENITLKA